MTMFSAQALTVNQRSRSNGECGSRAYKLQRDLGKQAYPNRVQPKPLVRGSGEEALITLEAFLQPSTEFPLNI